MSSTSTIMATHFRREDVLCVRFATHSCPWVPIEGFEASFAATRVCFLAVYVRSSRWRESVSVLCKAGKGFKTMDNVVDYPWQDDLCRPTDCKRPLFCMFLWGENCISWHWKAFKTSTIEHKKSLQKLSPQRSVPLSSQKLKLKNNLALSCIAACE